MAGLKTVTYAKISPKMVNPRDTARDIEEEEEEAEEEEDTFVAALPGAWR